MHACIIVITEKYAVVMHGSDTQRLTRSSLSLVWFPKVLADGSGQVGEAELGAPIVDALLGRFKACSILVLYPQTL